MICFKLLCLLMLEITLFSIVKCLFVKRLLILSKTRITCSSRTFNSNNPTKPHELILICGCTGTGKSTFGMEVAIAKGIVKCVSTDTIRQVLRCNSVDPAVLRSSYSGNGDPVHQWKETCQALQSSINGIVHDAISRGVSLILEGVHIVPEPGLIEVWKRSGGVAAGVVLFIQNEEIHKSLIFRRGEITKKGASKQLEGFDRIRAIQKEMIKLGSESDWLLIEQRPSLEPKPIDKLNEKLNSCLTHSSPPMNNYFI